MAKRDLKGIDGGLLVFMAALILTSLIYLVIFGIGQVKTAALEDRYGPMPLSLTVGSWIYHLSRIVIPLILFGRMLRIRRWGSVMLTVAGLWLLFVGVPLADWAYAVWLGYMPATFDDWPMVRNELLRGSFFALSGTAYLLASVRVANTYPRSDAPEVTAQHFE